MSDEPNADVDRVKKAAQDLAEHFDSVHIFATRAEDDSTVTVSWGCGNWFARYGQIRTWLIYKDEESRGEQRRSEEQ